MTTYTVRSSTRTHNTSDVAAREVHDSPFISDASALTIASWWQGPRVGRVLAQLSTTGECDYTALLQDIEDTIREADERHPLDSSDRAALAALAAWAGTNVSHL